MITIIIIDNKADNSNNVYLDIQYIYHGMPFKNYVKFYNGST